MRKRVFIFFWDVMASLYPAIVAIGKYPLGCILKPNSKLQINHGHLSESNKPIPV